MTICLTSLRRGKIWLRFSSTIKATTKWSSSSNLTISQRREKEKWMSNLRSLNVRCRMKIMCDREWSRKNSILNLSRLYLMIRNKMLSISLRGLLTIAYKSKKFQAVLKKDANPSIPNQPNLILFRFWGQKRHQTWRKAAMPVIANKSTFNQNTVLTTRFQISSHNARRRDRESTEKTGCLSSR